MNDSLLTAIFWISLFMVGYTYLGYPVLLWLLASIRQVSLNKHSPRSWPRVSVVIAAKDEAARLSSRIENILQQEYPADQLELVIIADGCRDATEDVLAQESSRLADSPTRLLHAALHPGRGKPAALNLGVTLATGEIIVFADCRQRFSPTAIQELVSCFQDPKLGAVSGELVFQAASNAGLKAEMGLYWRYEVLIRSLESASGSVVGATGAIYAMRRSLFRPIPEETLLDDVFIPLDVVAQGFRVGFDSTAEAWDSPSEDHRQEWRRKVRTLAGNWQLLSLRPALLFPWSNPLWWRLFSHKFCRLLVPWWILSLLTCALLLPGIIPRIVVLGLSGYFLTVAFTALIPTLRRWPLTRFAYFFALLNVAAVHGFWLWVSGNCSRVWHNPANKK